MNASSASSLRRLLFVATFACYLVLFVHAAAAGEWIKETTHGCLVWNPHPEPGDRVSWSGPCQGGKANGYGVKEWTQRGKIVERYEGLMKDGLNEGKGRLEGGLGQVTSGLIQATLAPALVIEGDFKAGKPHGYAERRYRDKGLLVIYGKHYNGVMSGCAIKETDRTVEFVGVQHFLNLEINYSTLDYEGIGQCDAGVFEYFSQRTERKAIKKPLFENGSTALHAVAEYGDFEALDMLLRLGLDPNASRNNDGETPLHRVARRDHDQVKLAALLIANGAILDAQTPTVRGRGGETPLRLAVRHENIGICRLLLRSGASVNLGKKYGNRYQLPLDDALDTENKDLIALIRSYGGRSGGEESIVSDIAKLVVLAAAVTLAAAVVHDARRESDASKGRGSVSPSASSNSSSRSQFAAATVTVEGVSLDWCENSCDVSVKFQPLDEGARRYYYDGFTVPVHLLANLFGGHKGSGTTRAVPVGTHWRVSALGCQMEWNGNDEDLVFRKSNGVDCYAF